MSLKKAFTDAFTFSPRTKVRYNMYNISEPIIEDMTIPANRSRRNVSSDIAIKMNRRI